MLATRLLRRGIGSFFGSGDTGLRFILHDGSEVANTSERPATTIRFHTSASEWRTVAFGHIGFLESYFASEIDIEGDLSALLRATDNAHYSRANPLVRLRNRWHELRFSNRTVAGARANARAHYGLPREFFRYWLDDPTMTYTCAYWKEGTTTLEQAQRNKLEHVCRKLRLQPGEEVADIGCGWGGLMYHARREYGVQVTGYNACTEQVEALRGDIHQDGLGDALTVYEADHREVDRQFDKVAHIGVLEHCGRDQLRAGIEALAQATRPGGLGVLHYIGHVGHYETEFYIRKHIFPGGWIPSLSQCLDIMEGNGLEILDIENLRRHYAYTLDAWAERFDTRWDDIHRLDPQHFDEYFRRNWRIYLHGCADMFRSPAGYTHLFQIVFSKSHVGQQYPMSRAHLYAPDFEAGRDDPAQAAG